MEAQGRLFGETWRRGRDLLAGSPATGYEDYYNQEQDDD